MRKYFVGILIGASLMFSVQSFAAIGDKVEAVFAEFNLVINGQARVMQESPLVVNGTSYIPLRSVSNLLGYDVTYKSDSRTIELSNGSKGVTDNVYGKKTVTDSVYGNVAPQTPSPTAQPTPIVTPVSTPNLTPTPTAMIPSQSDIDNFPTIKDSLSPEKEAIITKIDNYLIDSDSPALMIDNDIYLPLRAGLIKYGLRDKVNYNPDKMELIFLTKNTKFQAQPKFISGASAFTHDGRLFVKENVLIEMSR